MCVMREKPLVLVVEDDEEMNRLECELLELWGMDAVSAYTGTEAVELAKKCEADAVLLDIMLPEMDGFEACRKICLQNDRHMPVIIISALDSDDCRHRGSEVGADAYFAKPFDIDGLVETLHKLIDKARDNGKGKAETQ